MLCDYRMFFAFMSTDTKNNIFLFACRKFQSERKLGTLSSFNNNYGKNVFFERLVTTQVNVH